MPNYERSLSDARNFIFDLDYTVWHWSELIDGVKDTIRELKADGKNVFYVTNNSLLTREEFADKLTDLGLKTEPDEVVSSAYVAAQTFAKEDINTVYAIGEQGLVDELEAEHIKTADRADDVVIGLDRNFNYWKLADAAELVRNGATLWVCGEGTTFRAGDRVLPGDKSLIEAVKAAGKTDTYERLGKPSDHMIKVIKDAFPIVPDKTVFVGDHIETDVVTGNKMGVKTGLVLGGESEKEELHDVSGLKVPNYVFEEFKRILMKV